MKYIFLALFCLSTTALADSFYVNEIGSSNLAKEEASTVTEIIRNSVSDDGSNSIVEEAREADFILRGKVLKLGSSYLMTLEKVKKNKVVFSSQLKSDKVEDLDNVAIRLTRSVIREVQPKSDTRVSEVNENDKVDGSKRKDTLNRWQIALGGGIHTNVNTNNTAFNFLIGYEWEIPTSNAAIKLFWEGTTYLTNFALGGSYFFNDRDTSPVVTADLGYGSAITSTDNIITSLSSTITGFTLGAGGGYRFFRTSKVNLELLAHYTYQFNKNAYGNPSLFSVKLGIYF